MKKKIIIPFCFMIFMFFLCQVSLAQIPKYNRAIGARISSYAPDDETVQGVKIDPDASALLEGNLTWFGSEYFSLEFSLGYTKMDVDVTGLGVTANFGELKQFQFLLTGRFHWWNSDSNLTIYGGGGIGYYYNDFSLSDTFTMALPGVTVKVDNDLGYHLVAGLEWFITENWAANFDLKYIWTNADFYAPGFSGELDVALDTFVPGIGIKYYF